MRMDVAASLVTALRDGPLGRRTLVRRTGVTESTVRTHLNKLRARGWVAFAKAGTTLTDAGSKAFAPLLDSVRGARPVALADLGLHGVQLAVHLSGVRLPAGSTWALRDRAIWAGASGGLVLAVNDRLRFPDTGEPMGTTNPRSEAALLEAFGGLARGDAVLVAFAPARAGATLGAWAMVVAALGLGDLDAQNMPEGSRKERLR